MVNNDGELFERLFGDIFKNPPTAEEIERIKREEEEFEKQAAESRKQFDAYAMTLPGSEKASDENPIVQIKGEMDEWGNFVERAVTSSELVDEMLDDLFKGVFNKQENEVNHRQK